MTASLVGFAKVPEFDRVFEPPKKPASTDDLEAFFSGFAGVSVVKH